MQHQFSPKHRIAITVATLAAGALLTSQSLGLAQSQEPKPPAPPIAIGTPQPQAGAPASGLTGNTWQSPNFGVGVTWDPVAWAVNSEQIDLGYDGLLLGTDASSLFIEAYEGFPDTPQLCLEDANAEIAGRDLVTEVVPLPNRPLPETGFTEGARQLFGITARENDGTVYRGAEYVECRELPGGAMLEISWQVPIASYNAELPVVNALMANLVIPGAEPLIPELPGEPPANDPAM